MSTFNFLFHAAQPLFDCYVIYCYDIYVDTKD